MAKAAKKTGTKRGPYKKKSAKANTIVSSSGRREVASILKNYTFDPDPKGKMQPYDAFISIDSPSDQSKHAEMFMNFSSFFKKEEERNYMSVAFGYDAKRYSQGGRGHADLVAIFDSDPHAAQSAPINKSKNIHSRKHIATIMRVLRVKLPERGKKTEIFLTLEHVDANVYRITELKDYTREIKPIQTGE